METIGDVRFFFKELTGKYSLNFHPDTPFEDFDVLTKTEAKAVNKKMDRAFEICEKGKCHNAKPEAPKKDIDIKLSIC